MDHKYKGVILAGGKGSRLYPITNHISKSLLPIYDKPLIYYPLSTLMLMDIRDIAIITNGTDTTLFQKCLGDGSDFGVNIEYLEQPQPNGIAEAFLIARDFIGNSPVCLILGDNIFHGQSLGVILKNGLQACRTINDRPHDAVVVTYGVADPERYGVAEYVNGKIVSIEEKPSSPKSNQAVTGLYFYPPDVVDVASVLKPSRRGELEVTDVNRYYLDCNRLRDIKLGRGAAWLDSGTFDSLLEASTYMATIEKRQGSKVACLEEIALDKKWITVEQCLSRIYPNEYGQYLKRIANDQSDSSI